jgi:hypothetical protein
MAKIIDDDGVEYTILGNRPPKKGEMFFNEGRIKRAVFNFETRQLVVEKPPFRAKLSKTYWYIHIHEVAKVISRAEFGNLVDDGRYSTGNYFETEQQAEVALGEINSIFKETH